MVDGECANMLCLEVFCVPVPCVWEERCEKPWTDREYPRVLCVNADSSKVPCVHRHGPTAP